MTKRICLYAKVQRANAWFFNMHTNQIDKTRTTNDELKISEKYIKCSKFVTTISNIIQCNKVEESM